jgi:hypothetical protein
MALPSSSAASAATFLGLAFVPVTEKLTQNNHQSWKPQVFSAIKGAQAVSFIKPTAKPPLDRDENGNDNFRFSEIVFKFFFRFLGLNGNYNDNRKNENENDKNNKKTKAKMILPFSDHFRRLPYLAGNLPLVVTDSKTLNLNLFIDYIMYIL